MMNRILAFLFFTYIISSSLFSQETELLIINHSELYGFDWSITNESDFEVIAGRDFFEEDSIFFLLDSDQRFFLNLSIPEVSDSGSNLLSLEMSGTPFILVSSNLGAGDHSIPFFTGYHPGYLKIIGGTDADIADFPWQVYFRAGNYLCGGSIIDKDWIVTAAHCAKDDENNDIPVSQMTIKAGATNRFSSTQGKVYEVDEVIIHESYNSTTYYHDIALLKLKSSIDVVNASPINLITEDDVKLGATDPGIMGWVTGWGITNVDPDIFPETLQKVQLPIVSNQTASEVWGYIPETILMAGYRTAVKDACSGDSGGPFAVPTLNGYKLAGIVSWGNNDCNTYGGYTRVSEYLDWIEQYSGVSTKLRPEEPAGDKQVCKGTESTPYSTEPVSGALYYEWDVSPEEAGSTQGDTRNGEVLWNPDFKGFAYVLVRVTTQDETSEWAATRIEVLKNTSILDQTDDSTVCENIILNLQTVAEGNDLAYQWYFNGTILPGENGTVLGLPDTKPENSGIYFCQVSGLCGTINSGNIDINVLENTNLISSSEDTQIPFDGDAELKVVAAGDNLKYSWTRDGDLIAGEENANIVISNVTANDIGIYQTSIVGTCGTVMSDSIYLYVMPPGTASAANAYLWPSLTTDYINVALSSGDPYDLYIFNNSGLKIYSKKSCRYQTLIPVNTYGKGLYFVRLISGNRDEVMKFIIQ